MFEKIREFWDRWSHREFGRYGEHYSITAGYNLTQPLRVGVSIDGAVLTDWFLDASVRFLPLYLYVTVTK